MSATRHRRLIDLHTAGESNALLGGKAAALARLAAAGFPVPDGVVVPADVDDADLERLATDVAAQLAGRRLAVRSSGVAEDLADASFAGQYETLLDVPPEAADILDALRRVRASAGDDRVATYGRRVDRAMAALVMPMVAANVAGIAFTRDPVTGRRTVIVEAVTGLADRLAAGDVAGERWSIGESAECQFSRGVLTAAQAETIADLARRVESFAGAPQDIEWAIANDGIVLLQARPITTLDDVEPIPVDEQPPPGPWAWDSTHSRAPMTPLTSSVFAPGFEAASRVLAESYGVPIDRLAATSIDGYLYIQVVPLAGKPGASTPPPFVLKLLFRVMPPMRRREKTARRALAERTDRKLLAAWRTEIRPEIEATLDGWWDLDRSRLADAELADHLAAAAELQHTTFRWNMITDPAYLLPLADLHDLVHDELGGDMEAVTRLLAGSSRSEYRESLRSLEERLTPAVRETISGTDGDVPDLLDRLDRADAGFGGAYRSHLRSHGTRSFGFDLATPTLAEDSWAELARLVVLPPDEDATRDALQFAAELRAELEPGNAARFDDLVVEARSAFPIREEGEAVHTRVLGALRLAALELGRRMKGAHHVEEAGQVVFLTLDECLAWLAAPADCRDTVRTRRGNHLWARGHTPPPFIGGEDPPPDVSVFPRGIRRIMQILDLVLAHDMSPASLEAGIDGVAASPGTHTGPVRIAFGPEDFGKVRTGDVLVSPITTSPWEVLFPAIGALVTEGGGLLSHTAIVAREYRLPAIVGCENATERFHDGQLVTVDGTTGTVIPVEGL